MGFIDRARRHENKNLSLPEGELDELNMPQATPGDAPYVNPRRSGPHVKDNTGSNPKKHPGRNY